MAEGGEAGGSGLNPARTESEEELAEAQRMRNRKANLLDLWGSTSVRFDHFERNLNSEELQAALERMGNKYRRVAEFGTHLGNQGAEQLRNERAIFELKPKVVPQEPSEAAVFLHLEKQYNELAEGLEQRAEKKYQRALVKPRVGHVNNSLFHAVLRQISNVPRGYSPAHLRMQLLNYMIDNAPKMQPLFGERLSLMGIPYYNHCTMLLEQEPGNVIHLACLRMMLGIPMVCIKPGVTVQKFKGNKVKKVWSTFTEFYADIDRQVQGEDMPIVIIFNGKEIFAPCMREEVIDVARAQAEANKALSTAADKLRELQEYVPEGCEFEKGVVAALGMCAQACDLVHSLQPLSGRANTALIPDPDKEKKAKEMKQRTSAKTAEEDDSEFATAMKESQQYYRSQVGNKMKALMCMCGKAFRSKAKLEEHKKDHKKNDAWNCSKCSAVLNSDTALKSHFLRTHLKIRRWACRVKQDAKSTCAREFDEMANFHLHLHKEHKLDGYEEYLKKSTCSTCKKSFSTRRVMLRHKKQCGSGEEKHPCPHCHKVLKNRETLKLHIEGHQNKRVTCEECGHEFKYQKTYKQHLPKCKGAEEKLRLEAKKKRKAERERAAAAAEDEEVLSEADSNVTGQESGEEVDLDEAIIDDVHMEED